MQRYLWLAVAASMAYAQTPLPDYFPLQVGNQWVYTFGQSVSVTAAAQANGVTYSVLERRYGSQVTSNALVRSDGAGKIYQYDPASQQEFLLYNFTQPVSGANFDNQPSTAAAAGHYSGPVGDFDNAFIIGQRTSLAGSTTIFLPYIGMVSTFLRNEVGSAASRRDSTA